MDPSAQLENTALPCSSTTDDENKPKFIESCYNPDITLPMLEKIFGYSRQAFLNWENEKSENTPTLKSRIEKLSSNSQRNRRIYSINDVRYLWQFFRDQQKLPQPPALPLSIAVWNNKGGVGKSCLSKELASIYSVLMGFKTLVVDCDAQADSTLLMNCIQSFDHLVDPDEDGDYQATIRDVIGWEDTDGNKYKCNISDALKHLSPTLSVIPSDREMTYLTLELKYKQGLRFNEKGQDISSLTTLEVFLEQLRSKFDYEIIIFDCNPDITEWVHNVLWSSDRLLIPVEIEPKCLHSLDNVYNHLKTIASLEDSYKFDKIIALPNKYHSGHEIDQEAIPKLRRRFPDIISKYILPDTTAAKQADKEQRPLFMAAFSGERKNLELVKRFTNQMWNVAHELLDMTPHKKFFDEETDAI